MYEYKPNPEEGEVLVRLQNRLNDKHIHLLCIPAGGDIWVGIVQEDSWFEREGPLERGVLGQGTGITTEGVESGTKLSSFPHPLVRPEEQFKMALERRLRHEDTATATDTRDRPRNFKINLSDDELDKLKALAKLDGLTAAAYVRRLVASEYRTHFAIGVAVEVLTVDRTSVPSDDVARLYSHMIGETFTGQQAAALCALDPTVVRTQDGLFKLRRPTRR